MSTLPAINAEHLIACASNSYGVPSVAVVVQADRLREFRQILHRALNTWPEGPKWAFDLCDLCDLTLEAGPCSKS